MWVASLVTCIWTLLMTPVLCWPVCEWLPLWAGFGSCWWYPVLFSPGSECILPCCIGGCWLCLSLSIQQVGGLFGGLGLDSVDDTHCWLFSLWVASVVNHTLTAKDVCPRLSRKWVASMVSCIWTPLTTPVLDSAVGEWLSSCAGFGTWWSQLSCPASGCLSSWAAFGPYLQCMFSMVQQVSGFCCELHLHSADHVYYWLSSLWVVLIASFIWILLMAAVLGSPVGQWLLWWARLGPGSPCLSLAFRKWVAFMVSWIWTLLTILVLCFPGSEWLCGELHVTSWPAHSLLFTGCAYLVLSCLSSLLITGINCHSSLWVFI